MGLLDKDYGEIVCAIVVPDVETKRKQEEEQRPAISLEELCSRAKHKLAPYKVLLTNDHHSHILQIAKLDSQSQASTINNYITYLFFPATNTTSCVGFTTS